MDGRKRDDRKQGDRKPDGSDGGWSKRLLWFVLIVGGTALLWQIVRAVQAYYRARGI